MARRWTPQRFVRMRRIRVIACVAAVALCSSVVFGVGARKTVALEINGETRTISTYALSVDRLLEEQGVDVKSHDQVDSTSGSVLTNHAVVSVRSAYQATISIDGEDVPFWTVAGSAQELLDYFEMNEHAAAKITVDIDNVYNQLTGGLVINQDGPVTVIADGTSSVAPDGKLPAASILDSKGITLGKDDRVSVEKDGDTVILRVRRVTRGTQTDTESIPFATRTVIDASLEPGVSVIRQQGSAGEQHLTYDVVYVDGVAESRTLTDTAVVRDAVEQIVAVGPAAQPDDGGDGDGNETPTPTPEPTTPSSPTTPAPSSQPTTPAPTTPAPTTPTNPPTSGGNQNADVWHPTPAQAQAWASGAAAALGWTGQQWEDLVWLWNHESGWQWDAKNPTSSAYGIPQCLIDVHPDCQGSGYHDNARVQMEWGMSYIKQRYGNPSKAREVWSQQSWY